MHQIHDLQPYHCTYKDCSDPGRLYGAKKEWINHENQHRRVWHCHSHEVEFETQPEYLQHLKGQHPEDKLEDYTPEMIAAVVGASAKPHRDCPFCPTGFSDVPTMQKHVRYHLERLSLYALPNIADDNNAELASERSSDNHQVIKNRRRKDSIENDFVEKRQVNLELTYRNQARWDEAEKSRGQVVEAFQSEFGADHPDTLMSMANLALAYQNQGRWGKAEKLLVSVLEVWKTELGADHPDTVTTMANLALAYQNQGRWKKAEKLLVYVWNVWKSKLGADHPDTLTTMANLALTYQNQGLWEKSEKPLVYVLKVWKRKLEADHPDTLTAMANLALTYQHQGLWEKAEKLLVHVVEVWKTKLGPGHPNTLKSIANLASTYQNQALGRRGRGAVGTCDRGLEDQARD